MLILQQKKYSVILVFMCMYMNVYASSEDESTPSKNVLDVLGINQYELTNTIEATSRAIHTWEIKDVVIAGSQFLQLWMESSKAKYDSSSSFEARQGYGNSFDPVLGFALLGGIVLAALVGWIAYILGSGRRKRDLTEDSMNVLSPATTANIINCIANAESSFTCLACVAMTGNGKNCLR